MRILVFLLVTLACSFVFAQKKELNLEAELVVDGIAVGWGMDWLPSGDLLITERSGTLYLWDGQALNEIEGVPAVKSKGQGGLLDVKVHPDFNTNSWIYLSFSRPMTGGEATTAVVRGELRGNKLVDIAEVFRAEPALSTNHHYGSRLVFDKDGYLYVSVGDRGKRDENPQALNNHCGKIHRINDDGSVPQDNPFVGNPIAMQTIYSYGHRNPQGLAIHPETGALWEHEHGPKGGDELNVIQPRKNYGWPVISYGVNYSGTKFTELTAKEGMLQPEVYWVPSIAPSGMDFVTSDKYGALKGDLLIGSLKFGYLHRCDLEGGKVVKEEKFLEGIGRVRSVRQGPDGFVYFTVEGKGVMRLIVQN
ncbi:PQQ-dependent sugar dehydrogenase [Marinoscillum furvescens]|uniref:Glucose/arabinose dehydrogenase n=1 Tax=Marinoscillum furvescens DSM 4134 TaxID=1122208 RepID=A0A3D9L3P1_MARFU|nr:PQQ-dependent sugar dehydrogenase [Marinoscillum furvescens]RED99420.1 glucose/arabinose dehydrogenase [Marinoscillum furvescens DSM 4134]